MSNSANTKRIAKNTGLLYIRTLLTMFVSLYTSRVVLNTLGIEDFGIYNVVGGIVVLFSFVTSALTASTQRFLNYYMGQGLSEKTNRVFCMSLNIHIIFSIIILVLAETIGLWYLKTKLVFPEDKFFIVTVVYQLSVFTSIVYILSVPYNAILISNERMGAFAYISLFESIIKLVIAFLIGYFLNRLLVYSMLLFILSILIRVIYTLYCQSRFPEYKYKLMWDKECFIQMFSFAGWNFFGASAGVASNQGVNLLLNFFYGPTLNATRAIAIQVQGAVNTFVLNFMTAVSPQIVKSYAADNIEYMFELVLKSSKYSFILLLIVTFPLLMELEMIMNLWLVDIPEYTIDFVRLTIFYSYTLSLTYALNMASQASGNVRIFQITEFLTLILVLPISYFFLKLGYSPNIVLYVLINLSILALFVRLLILRRIIDFPIHSFMKNVLFKCCLLFSVAYFILYFKIEIMSLTNLPSIIVAFLSLILLLFCMYFFAMTVSEREFLMKKSRSFILRLNK